jgi:acetyl-CoA carboxylase carboxyltransferase component
MTKPFDKDDTTMRNATEARRQREHKLLERVGYRKVKVSEEQEREAQLRRLEEKNDLLQKRIDTLLEDNDRLMLELQARVQSSVDDARRKSWGGNGRY